MKAVAVTCYLEHPEMTLEMLDALQGSLLPSETLPVVAVNSGGIVIEHPTIAQRLDLPRVSGAQSWNAGIMTAFDQHGADVAVCISNDAFPLVSGWLTMLLDKMDRSRAWVLAPETSFPEFSNNRYMGRLLGHDPEGLLLSFAPLVVCLIHRYAAAAVGLFDESYEHYYADGDFCRRLHEAGGKLLGVPGHWFEHRRSIETKTVFGVNTRPMMERDQARFIRKWGPGSLSDWGME
jgi:GT2 family glycosyltransferase